MRAPAHRGQLHLVPGLRQLGLDPRWAVTVQAPDPMLAALLDPLYDAGGAALADGASTEVLLAAVTAAGGCAHTATALLAELVAAGALEDAEPAHRRVDLRAHAVVLVCGSGPLTVGIVLGLLRAGVGTVHALPTGTVGSSDVGTGLVDDDIGSPWPTALRRAVRRLLPGRRIGPPRQRTHLDLVVLADDAPSGPGACATAGGPGAATMSLTDLRTGAVPHLPVGLRDGTGVVGPLILPWRTACWECLDRFRAHRLPHWPAVAAQLAGRRGLAAPECVGATVGLAVTQILAAIDGLAGGPPPPTLETTLELDLHTATVLHRRWAPWPDCSCGARPSAPTGPTTSDRGAT